MAEGKQTLPWLTQIPGWFGVGAMNPFLLEGFRETKPEMFKQLFGSEYETGINYDPETGDFIGTGDPNIPDSLWPFMRTTMEYDPWSYLGIGNRQGAGAPGAAGARSPDPLAGLGGPASPQFGAGAAVGGGGGVGIGGLGGSGVPPGAGPAGAGGPGIGPGAGGAGPGTPQPGPQGLLPSGFQRPGGATQPEQDLLNQSYFGRVAPLDLGNAAGAANAQQGMVGGIFSGQGPQAIMGGLYGGPGGGQYQMPQPPQAPGMQGLVTPEMAANAPMGQQQPPLGFPPIQIPQQGGGQGGPQPGPGQGVPPPQGMGGQGPQQQQMNPLIQALMQMGGSPAASLYGLGGILRPA